MRGRSKRRDNESYTRSPMMFDPSKLRNTYFIVRHGKSIANEQGIIVSDPRQGILGYSLTEQGRIETRKSAEKTKERGILDGSTVIFSSDFARTKETAEIFADVLETKDVIFAPKLRERSFGRWETTHSANYQKVWEADRDDHTHQDQGVESVADVLKRVISLIQELEERYVGQKILLVSHGDVLQILQTAFEGEHPSRHREVAYLGTAEMRRLN